MERFSALKFILDCGVIAIIRAPESTGLIEAAEAIVAGGVTAVEFTLTTLDALQSIGAARKRLGEQALAGNVRVRNQATVGGNLAEADCASDPPAMLIALDAKVKTVGASGSREIRLSKFFLGFFTTALEQSEIIAEVTVPPLAASARATYLKYTSRSAEDRPCVGVAAGVAFDQAGRCCDLRVAAGAAVETPRRVAEAEALAGGEVLGDDLIAAMADGYASRYRREMIRIFVRHALKTRDGDR